MITPRRTLLLVTLTMILLKINFSVAVSTEDKRDKVLALLATITAKKSESHEILQRENYSEKEKEKENDDAYIKRLGMK